MAMAHACCYYCCLGVAMQLKYSTLQLKYSTLQLKYSTLQLKYSTIQLKYSTPMPCSTFKTWL